MYSCREGCGHKVAWIESEPELQAFDSQIPTGCF